MNSNPAFFLNLGKRQAPYCLRAFARAVSCVWNLQPQMFMYWFVLVISVSAQMQLSLAQPSLTTQTTSLPPTATLCFYNLKVSC